MYPIYNEGKGVVAERFIRTSKTKINKYMTSVSENVYIDKLNDIVNKYNNTYHRAIKMTPVDVKNNTYIDSSKEVNDKDPKFKVGNYVRVSKYKNIFAKGHMYLDKLNDIVNEYNNIYHKTIKMKPPVDVKDNTYVDSSKEVNDKDPTFKVRIMLEYQNTKTFLLKDTCILIN